MEEANDSGHRVPALPLGPEVRQRSIDVLSESFAKDEIELGEFERRVELVGEAKSIEELRGILSDLPAGRPQAAVANLQPQPVVAPEDIPRHSFVAGVLGGGARGGAWLPARTNWALGVLGGCELDFCEAHLGSGVTEVRVMAVLGGVDVFVPPYVRVECSGLGILGGVDHHGAMTTGMDPDAPVIRITGVGILGGVGVRVRYPGETVRDAKRRSKIERKARKRISKGT